MKIKTACSASILVLSLASVMLSGCKKAESPEAPPAESTNAQAIVELPMLAERPAASNAVPTTAAASSEIPALTPDIVEMVSTNTGDPLSRIDAIERMNLTATEKAQAFLLVLPTLNKDGQRQFAHAAVKYVDDTTHSLIRKPLVEGKLNIQVLSVFMTDTLKRPNAVKLPTLVSIAGKAAHPMQEEAQQLLTAFFGQDRGTDLAQWRRDMQSYMLHNPN